MNFFFKNKKFQKKQNSGFMMVEVIIVTSIIAVSVLAFMAVAQKSIHLSRQSLHTVQAVFLLEEGAEAVRIIRDNNWDNITALSPSTTYYPEFSAGTWTMSSVSNATGIFTRTISIENVNRDDATDDIAVVGTNDDGTRLVTITVSWVEGGTSINKTLSFYISDIFSL